MSSFDEVFNFVECLGDAIVMTNDSSEITFVNSACAKLFGCSKDEMLSMRLDQLMSEEMSNHESMVKKFIDKKSKARTMLSRGTMPCLKASGDCFNARISISSVTINNQLFGIAIIQDFSSLQAELEQLEVSSNQDVLTGLYNRRYLQKIIEPKSRLTKAWKNIGVIYLDLNKFKPINDKYGHDVGDTVLSIVARRIQASVRFDDVVFRLGGDEFLIFLNMNDMENRETAILNIAEKIKQEVVQPITTQNADVSVGVSMGCSLYPDHSTNLEELINLADKAMYSAKKEGAGIKIIESVNCL